MGIYMGAETTAFLLFPCLERQIIITNNMKVKHISAIFTVFKVCACSTIIDITIIMQGLYTIIKQVAQSDITIMASKYIIIISKVGTRGSVVVIIIISKVGGIVDDRCRKVGAHSSVIVIIIISDITIMMQDAHNDITITASKCIIIISKVEAWSAKVSGIVDIINTAVEDTIIIIKSIEGLILAKFFNGGAG